MRADIDPRARSHLPIHHQALSLEFVEMLERRPASNQIAVGDQNARCFFVGAQNADRLAGLHHQRLIVFELRQRIDDAIERVPITRRLAAAAIDDELFRPFRDFRVEVVHQHAQRAFGLPALCVETRTPRRANGRSVRHSLPFHSRGTRLSTKTSRREAFRLSTSPRRSNHSARASNCLPFGRLNIKHKGGKVARERLQRQN